MVLINYATKEIIAKIVYYGPGLCGKTTNLLQVYEKLNPKKRGKMIALATESDRTLFFDFLPVEMGMVQGFKVRFQLYTVPGQVFYSATRKLVLKGADAVVFVADSQSYVMDKNVESLEDMKQNLRENDLDPDTLPLLLQYNKRDLPDVSEISELEGTLNWRKVPYYEACAVTGEGVMETFREITNLLIRDLKRKHSMMNTDGLKELPLDIFQPKPEKKPEETPNVFDVLDDVPLDSVIEMGSGYNDSSSFNAGSQKAAPGKMESISLSDPNQAEVFFDSYRKGDPMEDARQKAKNTPVSETPVKDDYAGGGRELTLEDFQEIDFSSEGAAPGNSTSVGSTGGNVIDLDMGLEDAAFSLDLGPEPVPPPKPAAKPVSAPPPAPKPAPTAPKAAPPKIKAPVELDVDGMDFTIPEPTPIFDEMSGKVNKADKKPVAAPVDTDPDAIDFTIPEPSPIFEMEAGMKGPLDLDEDEPKSVLQQTTNVMEKFIDQNRPGEDRPIWEQEGLSVQKPFWEDDSPEEPPTPPPPPPPKPQKAYPKPVPPVDAPKPAVAAAEVPAPVTVVQNIYPGLEKDLGSIIRTLELLGNEMKSIRADLDAIKDAPPPQPSERVIERVVEQSTPQQVMPVPDTSAITGRIDALEEMIKDSTEGQSRIMLSIIESVRESKKAQGDAYDKIEDGLKYIADKIRNQPSDGNKKKWF